MAAWPTITDGVTRLGNALFTSIKAYIDDLVGGQGLPTGGATNDILKKASGTNYDAAWTDAPTLDSVTFDTAAAEATGVAKLYWDATDVTAAVGLNANITYLLGAQELVRVSNRTGSAIAAGKVVYVIGAHGDRPEVALADASAEATSSKTLGIAAESIADADQGYVCVSGLLRNLNTDHLTEGGLVWLSETTGETTATRPTQPAHGVFLGLCVKKGPGTSGILYVSVVNGQELDELHDVLISTATAGDLLKRNAGNTLWVNAAPAALTKTDDTNVTLTLGGSASTALVNAASITAGWTGTLASSRLNSNVVQGVTNDTNVTGSIATQTLTLGWTGQLAIARGGTGASTQQAAMNALAGAVTSGQYLRGNGTNVLMSAIQVADVPTLNQNTTGSAASLTTARTLTIGGTGKTFNGSADVTWTLAEIGALSSSTSATQNGYFGDIYLYDDSTPSHYLQITNSANLTLARTLSINVNDANRTVSLSGDLTVSSAATISGTNTGDQTNISGNAATATTLQTARNINGTSFNGSAAITTASWGTARTITIGSTGKSVDGSGNVSWTLSELGAMAGGGYSANQNLNTTNGPTFAEVYVNGWFRNNTSGNGIYNQATGNHFYSDGAYWNVAYSGTQGIRFRNGHAGTVLGYVYAETNGNFGLLHDGGGWSIQISSGGNITMQKPVSGGQFISSDWFRNTGATGLYHNTYGRGILEAQAGGASYGNFLTYGAGLNGWTGWGCNTSGALSYLMFSGATGGIYLQNGIGWAFYYNPTNNNLGYGSGNTNASYSHTMNGAVLMTSNLYVNGSITATGTKSFEIKHPVDSTKKLRYAAIEGPRLDLLHRGTVVVTGTTATVNIDTALDLLPGTFEALCREPQCVVANNTNFVAVRGQVVGNLLQIETAVPVTNLKLDWLIVAERRDHDVMTMEFTDDNGRLVNEYEEGDLVMDEAPTMPVPPAKPFKAPKKEKKRRVR